MIEYCIYCKYYNGTPFILKSYKTFQEAYNSLMIIISTETKRNRMYYVDNDFFENNYPCLIGSCKYFCIMEREVTDWKKYEEHKNNQNSKIIYLNSLDFNRGL